MAQMWLLRLPKYTSTTTTKTGASDTTTTTATTSTSTAVKNTVEKNGGTQDCCCWGLRKVLKKLKRQGRMLRAATTSRQSSLECRYDPLSYSLNFDTSGCGSLVDDQDYYQFCAFSSRFVGNIPRTSSYPRLVSPSH
ncbi:hypothetical protein JCGZ_15266 [Jatropha curcas]|uniref:Uncharacterized protein n=1 Tax=Jatropha curcas TaxID=180498 RepID=A0A067K345_JATCU|nr:uncharacterized protein LOC105641066 [Jatropha curcas]KDP30557.1 hypothetical protein JCGZ_15266 [Jatropha curcas]